MQTIDPQKLKDLHLPKDVEEVYLYLKAYSEPPERKAWEKRYNEAWKLIENDIWEGDEAQQIEAQKQVPIAVNDAVKGVQASCAVQTASKPEMKFYPKGGKGDIYVAELLMRGHDVIWDKNENGLNIYEWAEDRDIGAIGFIRARIDPNRGPFGKIVNETLETTSCYWDKDSRKRDFSDTHVIIANLRTKTYIMERYGDDLTDDDLFYNRDILQGGKSEGITTGDNYAAAQEGKIKSDDNIRSGAEEENNIWEIEALMRKYRDENWIVYRDERGHILTANLAPTPEEGEEPPPKMSEKEAEEQAPSMVPEGGQFIAFWPRKREIREIRIIVGKKMIQQIEDPSGEDSDGDPIVHVIGLKAQRTRNSFPMSPTNYSRDIVRMKNKALMQFIHAAAHNTNAPLREAEGAVRWEGAPGTPGSKAIIDIGKVQNLSSGVDRIAPGAAQIDRYLEIVVQAEKSIADQYDAPPFVKGQIPEGTDPSGRLALSIMDATQTISKPKLGSLEGAMVRLAKVNMALALKKWPREYWERLIEEEEWDTWIPEKEKSQLLAGDEQATGAPPGQMPELTNESKQLIRNRWQEALDLLRPADYSKPSGLSMIDIDVKITAGSSLPTNRIAKEQIATEKYDKGLYDRKAALDYSGDPKAEEIAARMDQAERAMMEAQAQAKGTGGMGR